MTPSVPYNSNLSKGTGLIEETLALLQVYQPAMDKDTFVAKVREQGILARSTENRTRDIIHRVFLPRYWPHEDDSAIHALKSLQDQYVDLELMSQILLVYTCRDNAILGDFIKEVYYPLQKRHYDRLTIDDFQDFIRTAISDGRIDPPWSESMVVRVGRYLAAALADFQLIDKQKRIRPHFIQLGTVKYLAHEMHFKGISDNSIPKAEDWAWFGLTEQEVIRQLEAVAHRGTYLLQNAGHLIKISWKYENMSQFVAHEY